MIKRILLLLTLSIVIPILSGQLCFAQTTPSTPEDLLKQLQTQEKPMTEYVIATFKSTKIINLQTNETIKQRNLDFRVSHLFGNIGKESGGGIHDLYGLDQSNDIRISFNYGITDKLMVGVARAKRNEAFEGQAKYKLLEQTTDGKTPLAITLFAQSAMTTKEDVEGFYQKFIHRLDYCGQIILARKFSPRLSFELVPTWVHRNLVELGDSNDIYSVGGGVRWKFTRSSAIVVDYAHNVFPKNRKGYQDPLGIGVEIETGGHVFTIMFTNAVGLLETDFIPNTYDSWNKGGMKFSFNISRMFKLGGKK